MSGKDISVVIRSLNSSTIDQALDSLRGQTYDVANAQSVVSPSMTTDSSGHIASTGSLQRKHPTEPWQVGSTRLDRHGLTPRSFAARPIGGRAHQLYLGTSCVRWIGDEARPRMSLRTSRLRSGR